MLLCSAGEVHQGRELSLFLNISVSSLFVSECLSFDTGVCYIFSGIFNRVLTRSLLVHASLRVQIGKYDLQASH